MASNFVLEQIKRMKNRFDKIYVLASIPYLPKVAKFIPFLSYANRQDAFAKNYSFDNVEVFFIRHIPPISDTLRLRIGWEIAKKALKIIKKKKIEFDLIHAHFAYPSGFAGAIIKRLFRKPLITSAYGYDLHDLPFRNYKWKKIISWVLRNSDHIIVAGEALLEIAKNFGVENSRISVIYNSYNEKIFKPIPKKHAREILGLPKDQKIIIAIGRLVPVKGHRYLIQAAKILTEKNPDIKIYIVGGGKLIYALSMLISKLNLQNKVFLVGSRPHTEIPLWINAADLIALPSLNEGCPVVILESMACGKPVVCSAVGCLPYIINDKVGILVESKNYIQLANALEEGLNRSWDYNYIREYSRRFSWKHSISRILDIYRSITH